MKIQTGYNLEGDKEINLETDTITILLNDNDWIRLVLDLDHNILGIYGSRTVSITPHADNHFSLKLQR